ncbi:MAG: hypothetical protein V1928_05650 [Parcubacteria group bacterium]
MNCLQKEIKKVFAIGGSGDFAFNLLNFLNLEEIILCDKKPMAEAVVDFKKMLFKCFNFAEIEGLFLKNEKEIFEKFLNAPAPRKIIPFESMLRGAGASPLIKTLKKSNLFYNESFCHLKQINEYLIYLQNEEKYEAMRAQLGKIKFIAGDFSEKLKSFPDNYFNLVYVSNILDSNDYSADNVDCLRTIKQKSSRGGLLLAVIQDKVDKQIDFIKQNGFELVKKEAHKFNFITSIKGHYYFSFVLFQKEE